MRRRWCGIGYACCSRCSKRHDLLPTWLWHNEKAHGAQQFFLTHYRSIVHLRYQSACIKYERLRPGTAHKGYSNVTKVSSACYLNRIVTGYGTGHVEFCVRHAGVLRACLGGNLFGTWWSRRLSDLTLLHAAGRYFGHLATLRAHKNSKKQCAASICISAWSLRKQAVNCVRMNAAETLKFVLGGVVEVLLHDDPLGLSGRRNGSAPNRSR